MHIQQTEIQIRNVASVRDDAFDKALYAYAEERTGDTDGFSAKDILAYCIRQDQLDSLDAFMQKRGIEVHPDHFCQRVYNCAHGMLDGYSAMTFDNVVKEHADNIIQFCIKKKKTFTPAALFIVATEALRTPLGTLLKAGRLQDILVPELWQYEPCALLELRKLVQEKHFNESEKIIQMIDSTIGSFPKLQTTIISPAALQRGYDPYHEAAFESAVQGFFDGRPLPEEAAISIKDKRAALALATLPRFLGGTDSLTELNTHLEAVLGRPLHPDDFFRISRDGCNAFCWPEIAPLVLEQFVDFFAKQSKVCSLDALYVMNRNQRRGVDIIWANPQSLSLVMADDFFGSDPSLLLGLRKLVSGDFLAAIDEVLAHKNIIPNNSAPPATGKAPVNRPAAVEAPPREFDNGLKDGFTPARSSDFHEMLEDYAAHKSITADDVLSFVATQDQGGVHGLHLLNEYLKQNYKCELEPDHFCQAISSGNLIGQTFFSYADKLEERMNSLIAYMAATKKLFTPKAVQAPDCQGRTMFDVICSSEQTLDTFLSMAISLGGNAKSVLGYMKQQKDLPFYQSRAIEIAFAKATSSKVPDIPNRGFRPRHAPAFMTVTANFVKNLTPDDIAFPLGYAAHTGVQTLKDLSAYLLKHTGYPLCGNDFLRLLPNEDDNLFSFSCATPRVIRNILSYCNETGMFFSHDILGVRNTDGLTPLQALSAAGLDEYFFDSSFFKEHKDFLRTCYSRSQGEQKEVIERCADKIQCDLPRPDTQKAPAPSPSSSFIDNRHDKIFNAGLGNLRRNFKSYREPLVGLASSLSFSDFLSAIQDIESVICRPVAADDFCKLNDEDCYSFQFEEDMKTGLSAIIQLLTDKRSVFSPKALLNVSNDQTVLDWIDYHNLEQVFYDPVYWQLSPESLQEISKLYPSHKKWVEKTLKEIDGLPASKRIQKLDVKQDDSKILDQAVQDQEKLRQIIGQIKIPSRESLIAWLEQRADNPFALWSFGDDIADIRKKFVFEAMRVTTSHSIQNNTASAIGQFLTEFAQGRNILDQYAQKMTDSSAKVAEQPKLLETTKEGSRATWFLSKMPSWLTFSREQTDQMVDLSKALEHTKNSGKLLGVISPGLETAQKQAAAKMTSFDLIVQANIKLEHALNVYIDAGEQFAREAISNEDFVRDVPDDVIEAEYKVTDMPDSAEPVGPATKSDTSSQDNDPQPISPSILRANDDVYCDERVSLSPVAQEVAPPKMEETNGLVSEVTGEPEIQAKPQITLTGRRPDEVSANRLQEKIEVLKSIRASVTNDIGVNRITGQCYGKHAAALSLQCGATIVNLASQVTNLHQTLDVLQGAESSNALAKASSSSAQDQVRDMVIAAKATFDSITTTVEGARSSVLALDAQTTTLLAGSGISLEPKITAQEKIAVAPRTVVAPSPHQGGTRRGGIRVSEGP